MVKNGIDFGLRTSDFGIMFADVCKMYGGTDVSFSRKENQI